MIKPRERLMEGVDQQVVGSSGRGRIDSPAFAMFMTVPIAALLWLAIIAAAFELFKWATVP